MYVCIIQEEGEFLRIHALPIVLLTTVGFPSTGIQDGDDSGGERAAGAIPLEWSVSKAQVGVVRMCKERKTLCLHVYIYLYIGKYLFIYLIVLICYARDMLDQEEKYWLNSLKARSRAKSRFDSILSLSLSLSLFSHNTRVPLPNLYLTINLLLALCSPSLSLL